MFREKKTVPERILELQQLEKDYEDYRSVTATKHASAIADSSKDMMQKSPDPMSSRLGVNQTQPSTAGKVSVARFSIMNPGYVYRARELGKKKSAIHKKEVECINQILKELQVQSPPHPALNLIIELERKVTQSGNNNAGLVSILVNIIIKLEKKEAERKQKSRSEENSNQKSLTELAVKLEAAKALKAMLQGAEFGVTGYSDWRDFCNGNFQKNAASEQTLRSDISTASRPTPP